MRLEKLKKEFSEIIMLMSEELQSPGLSLEQRTHLEKCLVSVRTVEKFMCKLLELRDGRFADSLTPELATTQAEPGILTKK